MQCHGSPNLSCSPFLSRGPNFLSLAVRWVICHCTIIQPIHTNAQYKHKSNKNKNILFKKMCGEDTPKCLYSVFRRWYLAVIFDIL